MTDLIERLRALLAKATPGPWQVQGARGKWFDSYGRPFPVHEVGQDGDSVAAVYFDHATAKGLIDAHLIADGISALPTLLDALEAKERELADLIHDMERLHDSLNGEAAARIQVESALARIANIAARLAEIARSVHIGDLERAEISALELELVKETL